MSTSNSSPLFSVGWMRRPSGGNMFVPGAVHLTTSDVDSFTHDTPRGDRDGVRTLCGRSIPAGGLVTDRGAGHFSVVADMPASDRAGATACQRCSAAAARRDGAQS